MKKLLIAASVAVLMLGMAVPATAAKHAADLTTNAPVNGRAYDISDGTQVKVDMVGVIGDHTPFTVRVIRRGTNRPVFHQTSVYRSDMDRMAVGDAFTVSVGSYQWRIDRTWSRQSNVVAGRFTVTP